MTSTYLYGLDDDDIPQDFHDELDRAAWLEWRPDAAALLNALLLAGWVSPSKSTRRHCAEGTCVMPQGHTGPCRGWSVVPG